MQKTWTILGLLLLLSVFIVSGCTAAVTDGSAGTPEPTPVNAPDPEAARDAVLATLAETYGDRAPALGLTWIETNVTAEGLVGGSAFQYTANGWVVKVTFPLVNPVDTVYHVLVSNEAAGFDWEGDVDANGVVVEVAGPEAVWYDPMAARDAVLATLAETYGDRAPALGLSWVKANMTAEGLVGSSAFQYTANEWIIKVTFPLVNPAATVYHVVVSNNASGFDWEGDVDADGVVVEVAGPEATWYDPTAARDAVLATLAENYGDRAPDLGLTWAETDVTPGVPDKPVPGSASLQYVAADWVMTLSYPVVRPDLVVYQVTVENAELGFKWEGKVDASGQVTELAAPSAETTVVAWYGYVVSTPDGAQFDDFVTILPEGQFGEFGIEGADESIEAEIVALRDHKKYANFWGTLRCDVIDYGGCQLLVTRIRSGMDMTDPEPVEGWEGTIVELFYDEPGAPHPDDAFILVGDYPVRYGIASYIAENGWPIYKEELEKRRDTGQTIRVWGQLVCGFPDVNACQIQVNRIEIDGTEVDAYEGWATYTNKEYGFSFRYPDTWEMVEQGEISGEPLPDVGTFIELGQGDWVFMIGVRHSSEDTNIFVNRTESLEQMGQVYFLGQEVPRMVWIQDDRTLAVRYGEVDIPPSWSSDCPPESVLFGGVIKEDNLVFTLSLWEFGDDWSNTADISPEVQVEVDQIISSFELTE